MSTNKKVELNLEDLDAVNGGSFWDDVVDFGKDVWKKTKAVILKLKN